MEKSIFQQYIDKFLPQLVLEIIERVNGQTNPSRTYLHRELLSVEYSTTGLWQSIVADFGRVMADIVAMDSPLPLKSRDSMGVATGKIPKVGLEFALNEEQLTALDTMVAQGADAGAIAQVLLNYIPNCIVGILERNEALFYEELSTGVAVTAPDDATLNNVGAGVRINMGIPAENQFNAAVVWSGNPDTATPLDDIRQLLDKAQLDDGNAVDVAYTDRATIDALLATKQVKEAYAFNVGFTGDSLMRPSLEQANVAIRARYGFEFRMVQHAFRSERDGARKPVYPWKAGMIAFAPAGRLGSLVWSRLAEANHRSPVKAYQEAEQYMLLSMHREISPSLREVTQGQARVAPFISKGLQIYLLDTTTVSA